MMILFYNPERSVSMSRWDKASATSFFMEGIQMLLFILQGVKASTNHGLKLSRY
jgi:hypothetical protein